MKTPNYSIYSMQVLLILCLVVFSLPTTLFAQESMSGGGYTLNGGTAVITGSGSGGGYTLNPSGDSTVSDADGGTYTAYPTPYSSAATNPTTSGATGGESTGGGPTYSSGFSPYPGSGTTSNQSGQNNGQVPGSTNGQEGNNEEVINTPEFYPSVDTAGVQWIDDGKGIDVNLDGKPDVFNDGCKTSDEKANQSSGFLSSIKNIFKTNCNPIIKTYPSSLSLTQTIFFALFFIAAISLPVVRLRGKYLVSRNLVTILVDYLIASHRAFPITTIPVININKNINGIKDAYYTKVRRFDRFALPVFAIVIALTLISKSWILSLFILIILAFRMHIGKRLRNDL